MFNFVPTAVLNYRPSVLSLYVDFNRPDHPKIEKIIVHSVL